MFRRKKQIRPRLFLKKFPAPTCSATKAHKKGTEPVLDSLCLPWFHSILFIRQTSKQRFIISSRIQDTDDLHAFSFFADTIKNEIIFHRAKPYFSTIYCKDLFKSPGKYLQSLDRVLKFSRYKSPVSGTDSSSAMERYTSSMSFSAGK